MGTPDFILELRRRVGTAPLWLSGATAVVVRPGPAGDEVLLVQRSDTGEWAPVSGIVDPGEHPHEAALREVLEEAGVSAAIDRLVWLTVTEQITYANGDQTQYIDHVFRCRYLDGDPAPIDGEAAQARFFAVHDLPPMPAINAERVAVALEHEGDVALGHAPRIAGAALPDAKQAIIDQLRSVRSELLATLDGLGESELRQPLTTNGRTLLGLVTSCAGLELSLLTAPFGVDPGWEITADGETGGGRWAIPSPSLSSVLAFHHHAAAMAERTIAALPLTTRGHVESWPATRGQVSLHEICLHLLTETARQVGQADSIREAIKDRR